MLAATGQLLSSLTRRNAEGQPEGLHVRAHPPHCTLADLLACMCVRACLSGFMTKFWADFVHM